MPVFAIALVVVEIVLTNRLAPSGHRVRQLDMAIDRLRQENDLLAQKVASASSLATISVRAQELGFVEPSKSQFVAVGSSELPVALHSNR